MIEKLLYYRKYTTNEKSQVLCAHKSFYDEIKELLKEYEAKDLLEVRYFEDDKSVSITRRWQWLDWYEVYAILKENGYIFTSKVQKEWEYFEKRHNEKIEKEKKESEPIKEVKEEPKEPKYEIVYWCGKYDCSTTLEFCQTCWYRIKFLEICHPVILKIKKKGE